MSIRLDHLAVLLTRPEPKVDTLCRMVNAAGGHAVRFPTIAFTQPDDPEQFQQSVKALGEQDWLIFVSPQAVYSAVPAIRRAWPVFPPRVKFAAVGKGTAQALQEAGYNAACYPAASEGSQGLLELPEFQDCKGLKIAVIRGKGGREIIDGQLALRGAKVLTLIAYQRVLPDIDNREVLALLEEHKIHAIVCTSFEGVSNLKVLIGERHWELLKKIPLCVISARIKKLANDLGFETIWVTREMSDAAILHLLANKRNQLL